MVDSGGLPIMVRHGYAPWPSTCHAGRRWPVEAWVEEEAEGVDGGAGVQRMHHGLETEGGRELVAVRGAVSGELGAGEEGRDALGSEGLVEARHTGGGGMVREQPAPLGGRAHEQ